MALSARIKFLVIVVGCFLLVGSTLQGTILTYAATLGPIYSATILLLVFAAILPARMILLSIPLAIAAFLGADYINELKIAAVALPITFLDLKMSFEDPAVLLNAVGIRRFIVALGALVIAIVAAVVLFWCLRNGRRRQKLERQRRGGVGQSALLTVVALALILFAADRSLAAYGTFVRDNIPNLYPEISLELWQPSGQASLSRRLGFLEYLAFTYMVGNEDSFDTSTARPYPANDVLQAVNDLLPAPVHWNTGPLPNIVFFHAESSFDPNIIFELSKRVDLPLWSGTNATVSRGPLRVNAVGGGSWITEFEVLTGVDSRPFGYQGFYTHQYIAPHVRNSLVTYLRRKGYDTTAYYSAKGSFYDTERAFKQYGFDKFIDADDLGLTDDWSDTDRAIIGKVLEQGAFRQQGPFFYFISTMENHGPHPCRHYREGDNLRVTFRASASFAQNCAINEYFRRAESTSAAFELVLAKLVRIEATTGRPFVLLVYGDHQPWSFTDGLYSVAGGEVADTAMGTFSGLRATKDGHITFYHLLASQGGVVLPSFNEPPPVTFLPSLISAFTAASDKDLYMPINFLAFSRCGSDYQRSTCLLAPDLVQRWKSALLKGERPSAN